MSLSRPLATLAALAVLAAALVARTMRTPAPLPASAPATAFSAERALVHLRAITQGPHPSGSAGHRAVREYLVSQLRAMGLEPQLQEATAVGTRYPAAGHVVNVIARVPGRETATRKAVLIAVHYDGVWASPAASDDGAGVAALLETLRALRAAGPLEHDVIALFSDAEEAGLLGAAAFVREHPWAKDVEAVLDFEARGTEGRSLMFETGAGNLDAARVLRTVDDVSAGSLLVTVYRSLPNDTDLSELLLLNKPALNFAFVDGVERYHTAHDDVAHLAPGSLQHHGDQMLALVRAFGAGPLPRPVTGDAIFFDFPFLGIIVFPESWGLPIALVAVALMAAVLGVRTRRERRWGLGVGLGVLGILISVGVGAFGAMKLGGVIENLHTARGWDGWPSWRVQYAVALALFALAVVASLWAVLRRYASAPALHAGALITWTLLAVATTVRLPGAMYLFTVPVIGWLIAALVPQRVATVMQWIATAVAMSLLVPVIYTTGGYTLPLAGPGGVAAGAIVALLAWLLAPHLETIGGERRWRPAGGFALGSLLLLAVGAATVRRNERYASIANLTYVINVDADSAYLVAPLASARGSSWAASAFDARRVELRAADADSTAQWLFNTRGVPRDVAAMALPRVVDGAPSATVLADTVSGSMRRLRVRFTAPNGALSLAVNGAVFARAVSVDGRMLDTARYRAVPGALAVPFTAPPDSGFVLEFELPRDSIAELHLTAAASGLPAVPGLRIPPRPPDVVQVQNGDGTVWYRKVRLTPVNRDHP